MKARKLLSRLLSLALLAGMLAGLLPALTAPAAADGDDPRTLSHKLEGVAVTEIGGYHADEDLIAALTSGGNKVIKLTRDVTLDLTNSQYNITKYSSSHSREACIQIKGVKALDLNGHTISGVNDIALQDNYTFSSTGGFSTLFQVNRGCYLELYDSVGGGWVTYDGRIRDAYEWPRRDVFDVYGTLVLNGVNIQSGHVKSYTCFDVREGVFKTAHKQTEGTAVTVKSGGFVLMNDGLLIGRGDGEYSGQREAGLKVLAGGKARIYGGTISGNGEADALRCSGDVLAYQARFTVECMKWIGYEDDEWAQFCKKATCGALPAADSRIIAPGCIGAAGGEGRGYWMTVGRCEMFRDLGTLEPQTLEGEHPVLSVPASERFFPELEGMYFLKDVYSLCYDWAWYDVDAGEWRSVTTASGEIDVTSAWQAQGFVPVYDREYRVRCTVIERFDGVNWFSCFDAFPFCITAIQQPKITSSSGGTLSSPTITEYHMGGSVEMYVNAYGKDLKYQWWGAGHEIPGATESRLTVSDLTGANHGQQYYCFIYNDYGAAEFAAATILRMVPNTVHEIELGDSNWWYYGESDPTPTRGFPLRTDFTSHTDGVEVWRATWTLGHPAYPDQYVKVTHGYTDQTLRLEVELLADGYTQVAAKNQTVVWLNGIPGEEMYRAVRNGDLYLIYIWEFKVKPNNGSADYIGWDVKLGIDEPMGGAVCGSAYALAGNYFDATDLDVRFQVDRTEWYCDGRLVEPGSKFLLYANYTVKVYLSAQGRWEFGNMTTRVNLDGEPMRVEYCNDKTLIVSREYAVTEAADFVNYDIEVADYAKASNYNSDDLLDTQSDDPPMSFVPGSDNAPSDGNAGPQAALMDDTPSSVGTLVLSGDITENCTVLNNYEDGLVIYVADDVKLRCTGGDSAILLNADTTITGPGVLHIIVDEDGALTNGPAAIQVNGCKLTVKDTTIIAYGCNGLRGRDADGKKASLELDHSRLSIWSNQGGLFGFNGGVALDDCVVMRPEEYLIESNTGIYSREIGHRPFSYVSIEACRFVDSVSIDGVDPDNNAIALDVGETRQFRATVLPDDASDKHLVWTSSTDDVSVTQDGLVTALRVGGGAVTVSCGDQCATVNVNVNEKEVPVEDVRIVPDEVTVGVGTKAPLRAVLVPGYATDHIGTWYTTDSSVAVLNVDEDWRTITEESVLVTGVTAGEDAEICVISWNGCAGVCTVHVVADYVSAEQVQIDGESYRVVKAGDEIQLTATVYPENASDRTVIWSSMDPDILTVDETGCVTAVGAGAAEIQAQVWNGNVGAWESAYVTCSVQPSVTGLSLSAPADRLFVGDSMPLNAYAFPGNAADRSVSYRSDNEAVATVSADGVVTAVDAGSTQIWASTNDGGFADFVSVTVERPPKRVTDIQLSTDAMTIPVGGRRRLELDVTPEDADDRFWDVRVEGPAAAAVVEVENRFQEGCDIVGVAEGTVTLVFWTLDGNKTARLNVTVRSAEDYVPVERVELPPELYLGVGQSRALAPTVYPENASERNVVVTVDMQDGTLSAHRGVITGEQPGTANISVRVGEQGAVTTVCVVQPVTELALEDQAIALSYGETRTLQATVLPADAYESSLTWTSADERVVTVDGSGKLSAVGVGTTYITAYNAFSGLGQSCTVTVAAKTYPLWIDGVQVDDVNLGAVTDLSPFSYDPASNTLTVAGDAIGSGRTPLIRSEIDGLTIQIHEDAALTNSKSVFSLSADTTITGSGALHISAGTAAAFRVSGGAKLTVQDATLAIHGSTGLLGTGTGEKLEAVHATITATGIASAVSGFDGGMTLSLCHLTGGAVLGEGTVNASDGSPAAQIEIVPGSPEHDFDGDGAVDADDAAWLVMNRLFGEGSYPVGEADCDFNGDGKTDLNDAVSFLFHAVFPDPAHPLSQFVATAYDADGRMAETRVIDGSRPLHDSDLAFLKRAAELCFFYLDDGAAPMAEASRYPR